MIDFFNCSFCICFAAENKTPCFLTDPGQSVPRTSCYNNVRMVAEKIRNWFNDTHLYGKKSYYFICQKVFYYFSVAWFTACIKTVDDKVSGIMKND